MLKYIILILLSFFILGCVVSPIKTSESELSRLSHVLQLLDKSISSQECMSLSADIFNKTAKLTEEFELSSPPLWHNFLVNIGFREKGLCYHWSNALYAHLKKKYTSFTFHLVGANIGEYFLEHNALVVVKKGGKIKNGVLIDPWRNSGKLYFSSVKKDIQYTWAHRTDRGCNP